jgi:hypothetical protein
MTASISSLGKRFFMEYVTNLHIFTPSFFV